MPSLAGRPAPSLIDSGPADVTAPRAGRRGEWRMTGSLERAVRQADRVAPIDLDRPPDRAAARTPNGQSPPRRNSLLPNQVSGSYLRSTTRSFIGMMPLSVILMCSGQTSVQHLVMLQ